MKLAAGETALVYEDQPQVLPVRKRRSPSPSPDLVENKKRANLLNGKEWLRNSISVWSDIVKNKDERALKHPAMFPEALVSRVLDCFLNSTGRVVLDPFMGLGTTLLAACNAGHSGVGFELYANFADQARERLVEHSGCYTIINESASSVNSHLLPESVDIVVTSPPYWNMLSRRRTADCKDIRKYGKDQVDLGNIDNYEEFLNQLVQIMYKVRSVLKRGCYCVVNVMDLRVKNRLYTFHSDLYSEMQKIGFILDDIVIWDRGKEYNNLRPLGYPYKFRINRVHEYLLIFEKT